MAIKLSHTYSFLAIGKKENQEDALWPSVPDGSSRVLILCDGMGGHKDGEVASNCVAETLGKELSALPLSTMDKTIQIVNDTLAKAYANLDKLDNADSLGNTMGTTLAMAIPCNDGILVAHIGDSRVYLFRKSKGVVFRTRDHSVVAELIACGEMTEEEARLSPLKNRITQAIQPHQPTPATPTFDKLTDICNGDILFLCSDGVIEQITDSELADTILSSDNLNDNVERVKRMCEERNTRDNHSCIAVQISVTNTNKNTAKPSFWQNIVKILSR